MSRYDVALGKGSFPAPVVEENPNREVVFGMKLEYFSMVSFFQSLVLTLAAYRYSILQGAHHGVPWRDVSVLRNAANQQCLQAQHSGLLHGFHCYEETDGTVRIQVHMSLALESFTLSFAAHEVSLEPVRRGIFLAMERPLGEGSTKSRKHYPVDIFHVRFEPGVSGMAIVGIGHDDACF